ncbi:MAG: hypothetical protein VXY41_01365, partial [Pseudomonadota bacterium]|nr:hypothetical protein [Pseudomonadota bacterium]
MPRFLVLDGYDKAGRAALRAAGATPAGTLYRKMVFRYLPEAEVDIVHPADPQSGIDDLDSDALLTNFVDRVALAGASRFAVHARKAWLEGLDPKQNRTIPP